MNLFHREFRRPTAIAARGYAWSASRHERALGVLLWVGFFAVLLLISR